MPKRNGTVFSGPLRTVRQNGASRTEGRTGSITITAQTAGSTGTYTISDTDAFVGDVVSVSPASAPEAGVVFASARVSADGTISIRIVNASAVSLTGGAQSFYYTISK